MNRAKKTFAHFVYVWFLISACDAEIFNWMLEKTLDLIVPLSSDPSNLQIIEEARMGVTELIEYYGYAAENHTVQTKDGYLLDVQRIPRSKNGANPTQPFPILFQHGLFCCSGNFIDNGKDSLAFFFADAGFDVWLGNLRGNLYARKHMTLSPHEDSFWDFSWDEHAAYDLPMMIDYIRYHTGINRIILIPHSLGTTVTFAMLASQPEYNQKVKAVIALGPVGSLRYITSVSRRAAEGRRVLESAVNVGGIKEFIAHRDVVQSILLRLCPSNNSFFCDLIMSSDAGYDPFLLNRTRLPIFLNHCNAGTSIKVLEHLGQMFESVNMTHFDYGSTKNRLVFGQEFPPVYPLSRITSPIALIHAANDVLADPLDVESLSRQLKSVVIKELFPYAVGTHYSFFWSKNATEIFYNRLYEIVQILINK